MTPSSSSCACGPTFNPRQIEHSRSAVLQVWRSQSLCQRLPSAQGQITKNAPGDTLLSVPATRTCHIEVSGKQSKRQEANTTLSPYKLEEVLPVMKVKVNGMDRIALVYSSCSSFIVSGMLCQPEIRKSTAILTAGRKCLLSHGIGSITLTVTNRNPLKMNMLVVNSKPLIFNLLLGINVIKKLGDVHIDEGGKAHFAEVTLALGVTIELEQPDFCAEFDQHTKS